MEKRLFLLLDKIEGAHSVPMRRILKSDYQKEIESSGWKFLGNYRADQYFKEQDIMDHGGRHPLRSLRNDLATHLDCRVRLARAYDLKTRGLIPSDKRVVGIYYRDHPKQQELRLE